MKRFIKHADPRVDMADVNTLEAQNAALRCELDLLRDALERMPHGMCAFDGQDRLVLANARYRKIWSLPDELVRPGTTFREIIAATPGRETAASRSPCSVQSRRPSATALCSTAAARSRSRSEIRSSSSAMTPVYDVIVMSTRRQFSRV